MVVRVVDIETTGTDPTTDAIIEIASVDLLADGAIANRQSTLVRPGIPVPPEASAVHHLLEEDLAGAPPLMDVVEMFRGADAYVAHNAEFERFGRCSARQRGSAPTRPPCASGRTCRRTQTRRSGIASAMRAPSASTATP